MIDISELSNRLRNLQGAKFVGLTYRAKSSGELARHTLILGASYQNTIEKSILEMELIKSDLAAIAQENGLDLVLMQQAYDEVVASLKESLAAITEGREHKDYIKAGMYESIVPNIKVNLNDLTFEVSGLTHAKVVIEPGGL